MGKSKEPTRGSVRGSGASALEVCRAPGACDCDKGLPKSRGNGSHKVTETRGHGEVSVADLFGPARVGKTVRYGTHRICHTCMRCGLTCVAVLMTGRMNWSEIHATIRSGDTRSWPGTGSYV